MVRPVSSARSCVGFPLVFFTSDNKVLGHQQVHGRMVVKNSFFLQPCFDILLICA